MTTLLLIETATPVCSVALAREDEILMELHSDEPNAHSSQLSPFIGQLFDRCGLAPAQLDAVCVSSGPGSYTGLRIGVSTAKGMCYALDRPLLAVPTLQGMAAQYYTQNPEYKGMVCPMIDARRMECYTAVFASPVEELKPVSADIITEGIYDQWLNRGEVTFTLCTPPCALLLRLCSFGNGSADGSPREDESRTLRRRGLLRALLPQGFCGQEIGSARITLKHMPSKLDNFNFQFKKCCATL